MLNHSPSKSLATVLKYARQFMNAAQNPLLPTPLPKMDAEGVHIYFMPDGDAGLTLFASETHSPYVDNRPLLTAGKPKTRQYKAMFFLGKSEIGLPSDVAQATAKP